VQNGDLTLMTWLKDNGCPWGNCACATAARCGDRKLVAWLRSHRVLWGDDFGCQVVYDGCVDVLKWAIKVGFPLDTATDRPCVAAACMGKWELLKWMIKNGFAVSEEVFYEVARESNLKMLQWLRENGCTWDETVCVAAASNGRLDLEVGPERLPLGSEGLSLLVEVSHASDCCS